MAVTSIYAAMSRKPKERKTMPTNATKVVSANLADIWARWKAAVATNTNPTTTREYRDLRTWSTNLIVHRTIGKQQKAAPDIVDCHFIDRPVPEIAAETIVEYLDWLDEAIDQARLLKTA